ncbi:hypothetical protein B6N38_11865 [Cutibacterium avidum]|nr:hypothetical protein B6N38_11865 [Cutibacterium avidum]
MHEDEQREDRPRDGHDQFQCDVGGTRCAACTNGHGIPPALKFTSLSNVRHAHGVITLSLLSEQPKGRRFPKTHRGRDT